MGESFKRNHSAPQRKQLQAQRKAERTLNTRPLSQQVWKFANRSRNTHYRLYQTFYKEKKIALSKKEKEKKSLQQFMTLTPWD